MVRSVRTTVTAVVAVAVIAVVGCEEPQPAAPEDEVTPAPTVEPDGPPPDELAPDETEPDEPDEPDVTEEPREPRRAADLPGSRTEVTGTTWGERVIAVGGLDEAGAAMSNVDIYDPEADTWSRGPDLPVALHHTAVATLDERVYVVGGYSIREGSWVAEATVWSLGQNEDEWREESPLDTARGALAVTSTGDRLVAVGGVAPDGTVLATTEVLESGAGEWVPGPALSTAREHLAATAVGDEVYAIAGREGGDFTTNRDSVEVLRDEAWQDAGTLNQSRGGIGAATVHGIPCVTGGEQDTGTIGSVECLIDGSWDIIAELDVPRHGLVVAAFDGWLHVVGGGPEPRLTISSVHEVIPIPTP